MERQFAVVLGQHFEHPLFLRFKSHNVTKDGDVARGHHGEGLNPLSDHFLLGINVLL